MMAQPAKTRVDALDIFRIIVGGVLILTWIALAFYDAAHTEYEMSIETYAALLLPAGWLFSTPIAKTFVNRKNGNSKSTPKIDVDGEEGGVKL